MAVPRERLQPACLRHCQPLPAPWVHSARRWFGRVIIAGGLIVGTNLILPLSHAAPVVATNAYLEMPLKPALRDLESAGVRKSRTTVRKVLSDQSPYDAEARKLVKDWYTQAIFARMTRIEFLHEMAATRTAIEQDLSENYTRSAQARRDLVALTRDEMKKMMAGNYHPAVRTNACLILGNMNSSEPRGGPPVPMAENLPELVAALINPEQIDAVRAAALVGIERHVDLRRRFSSVGPLPEDQATSVANAMVAILRQSEAPAGRNQAGNDWMRESAARVLGRLGTPGEKGSHIDALVALVEDERAGLDGRTVAARALGQVQMAGVSKPTANDLAQKMVKVAVACCDEELRRIGESSGTGNEAVPATRGPVPPAMDKEKDKNGEIPYADPATEPVRRRLAGRMHRIRLGIAGDQKPSTVYQLAEANSQLELIKQGSDAIDGVMQTLVDRTTVMPDFRAALLAKRNALHSILSSGTPGVRAPDAAAETAAEPAPASPAATTPESDAAPF